MTTDWKPTHYHQNGGEYKLITAIARMQARDWVDKGGPGADESRPVDLSFVCVYQDHNGVIWVRPQAEFNERFKPIIHQPAPAPAIGKPDVAPLGEPDLYFVLNGLVNGEEGVKAIRAGGDPGVPEPDGWYFLQGEDSDGSGPWRTRAEAVRRSEAWKGMNQLDARDISKAFLFGHLSPMTPGERQGFLDAPEFCLCGEFGDFFVTVGWDPEDADWRCEVHLGDQAALVDLKEGTWERI